MGTTGENREQGGFDRAAWSLRVGAVQICSTADLQGNLTKCRALVDQAVAQGAQFVALPECFSFLGRGEGDKLAIAESVDDKERGPILGMLREAATKHGIHILGGGTPERVIGDAKRTYNTAV